MKVGYQDMGIAKMGELYQKDINYIFLSIVPIKYKSDMIRYEINLIRISIYVTAAAFLRSDILLL